MRDFTEPGIGSWFTGQSYREGKKHREEICGHIPTVFSKRRICTMVNLVRGSSWRSAQVENPNHLSLQDGSKVVSVPKDCLLTSIDPMNDRPVSLCGA